MDDERLQGPIDCGGGSCGCVTGNAVSFHPHHPLYNGIKITIIATSRETTICHKRDKCIWYVYTK